MWSIPSVRYYLFILLFKQNHRVVCFFCLWSIGLWKLTQINTSKWTRSSEHAELLKQLSYFWELLWGCYFQISSLLWLELSAVFSLLQQIICTHFMKGLLITLIYCIGLQQKDKYSYNIHLKVTLITMTQLYFAKLQNDSSSSPQKHRFAHVPISGQEIISQILFIFVVAHFIQYNVLYINWQHNHRSVLKRNIPTGFSAYIPESSVFSVGASLNTSGRALHLLEL